TSILEDLTGTAGGLEALSELVEGLVLIPGTGLNPLIDTLNNVLGNLSGGASVGDLGGLLGGLLGGDLLGGVGDLLGGNLLGSVTDLLESVLGGLTGTDALLGTDLLNNLLSAGDTGGLLNLTGVLEGLGDSVGPVLNSLIGGLGSDAGNPTALAPVVTALQGLLSGIQGGNPIANVVNGLLGTGSDGGLLSGLTGAGSLLGTLTGGSGKDWGLISSLQGILKDVTTGTELLEPVSDLVDALIDPNGGTLAAITGPLNDLLALPGGLGVLESLENSLSAQGAGSPLGVLGEAVNGLLGNLNLADSITEAVDSLLNGITTHVQPTLGFLGGNDQKDNIETALENLQNLSGSADVLNLLGTTLGGLGNTGLSTLPTLLTDLSGGLLGAVGDLLEGVLGLVSDLVGGTRLVKDLDPSLIGGFGIDKAAGSLGANVQDIIGGTIDDVTGGLLHDLLDSLDLSALTHGLLGNAAAGIEPAAAPVAMAMAFTPALSDEGSSVLTALFQSEETESVADNAQGSDAGVLDLLLTQEVTLEAKEPSADTDSVANSQQNAELAGNTATAAVSENASAQPNEASHDVEPIAVPISSQISGDKGNETALTLAQQLQNNQLI
ncbi:hypothetical protein SAMN02745117_01955, partial [Lampropedia hyalina DSM 16112]